MDCERLEKGRLEASIFNTMEGSKPPPRKRCRTSQACDYCSRRSIRCQPSHEPESPSRCQNCVDFGLKCTYDRPVHKRGQKKRKPINAEPKSIKAASAATVDSSGFNSSTPNASESFDMRSLARAWKAFATASDVLMKELVESYYEIVYPIFPWFHRPTLFERIEKKEHLEDRGLFASVMAMCALVCTRIRDGAQAPRLGSPDEPNFEHFYDAASDAIPKDLTCATGIDYLRACGLLALTSMQNGQNASMHRWVGMYHSLSTLEGLWDETRWPKNMTPAASEERRCLFWSLYTFEVFNSIVCGTIVSNRESQSLVRYPTAMSGIIVGDSSAGDADSWLIGWNFTVDLYRILEHAIDGYRKRRSQSKPELFTMEQGPPNDLMLAKVQEMYLALPSVLRTVPPTHGPGDLNGFQATNIQASLALVQMVILASEKDDPDERKCGVVDELLNLFTHVPRTYLKAMGSPLLHHLACIGSLLASALEMPITDIAQTRVRKLLLDMSKLIESLESGARCKVGHTADIRRQIQALDECIPKQTQSRSHVLDVDLKARQDVVGSVGNGIIGGASNGFGNTTWQSSQQIAEWPWTSVSVQADANLLAPLGFEWD